MEPSSSRPPRGFSGSKVSPSSCCSWGLIITMGIGSRLRRCRLFQTTPSVTLASATATVVPSARRARWATPVPRPDSTLGPTAGLNVDGQHDHMRDTVTFEFIHYNIPLLIGGWTCRDGSLNVSRRFTSGRGRVHY